MLQQIGYRSFPVCSDVTVDEVFDISGQFHSQDDIQKRKDNCQTCKLNVDLNCTTCFLLWTCCSALVSGPINKDGDQAEPYHKAVSLCLAQQSCTRWGICLPTVIESVSMYKTLNSVSAHCFTNVGGWWNNISVLALISIRFCNTTLPCPLWMCHRLVSLPQTYSFPICKQTLINHTEKLSEALTSMHNSARTDANATAAAPSLSCLVVSH